MKHPKERVRHLGRALQDLGLLSINENQFSLTDLGQEYANHFNENKWVLSDTQIKLIREQLNNTEGQTPLIRSINKAIEICKELKSFTLDQFAPSLSMLLGCSRLGEKLPKNNGLFSCSTG